jgi:hypothetical protein
MKLQRKGVATIVGVALFFLAVLACYLYAYFSDADSLFYGFQFDAYRSVPVLLVEAFWGGLILYRVQERKTRFLVLGMIACMGAWTFSGFLKRLSTPPFEAYCESFCYSMMILGAGLFFFTMLHCFSRLTLKWPLRIFAFVWLA